MLGCFIPNAGFDLDALIRYNKTSSLFIFKCTLSIQQTLRWFSAQLTSKTFDQTPMQSKRKHDKADDKTVEQD